MADAAQGPSVAFCQRAQQPIELLYADELDFERDFGTNSPLASAPLSELDFSSSFEFVGVTVDAKVSQLMFHVDGWLNDQPAAHQGFRGFIKNAGMFLPDRPGRTELLEGLAHDWQKALRGAGQDMAFFTMRAEAPGRQADTFLHPDDTLLTGIIYLTDNDTTLHANAARARIGGLQDGSDEIRTPTLLLTRELAPHVGMSPRRALTLWQGLRGKRPSLHAVQATDRTKLICIMNSYGMPE